MHAALLAAVEETAEHVNELPVPPIVFGLGAFAGLIGLLLFTFAFRSIGSRH
ncbi:hypothetical protein [Cellulomonas marina]|uniref:Uncharacterized protein n=1 Tax=Cellulomonas marina TaxID=988821 RepID=A0A1I0YRF4_9CELL|nr:hypothetical protein [Cellulomonas marina]GIG27583.1 hypothetical protein Cma02nite_01830 [Cellulomonas marina]SFB15376.1 hypothetical protein SAMN05421867_10891 [Cellulomonas marina]